MNKLKRIWVSICRYRSRHGYGVHPPFAFELITDTLYAHPHFYAFRPLFHLRLKSTHALPHLSKSEDECLFRLVNRFQPDTVVQIGCGNGLSACYMAAAHPKAHYTAFDHQIHEEVAQHLQEYGVAYRSISGAETPLLTDFGTIDCLHLAHTEAYAELLEEAMAHFHADSFCIIEGIRSSKHKLAWWQQVIQDPRVGVSFDLYQRGLLFFDTSKPKQHYNS